MAADYILQLASSRSDLLFTRFGLRCFFLHVSAYICMFLTFSVCSFRASAALALCKCCCRKATTTRTKNMPDFIQIHPKSIKNPCKIHPKPITLVARTDPKATLRAIPQVIIPQGVFGSNFWRHLGDFGRHFGHRRVPRGCQNRAFWHRGASKVGKMRSGKGFRKTLENSQTLGVY